MCRIIVLAVTFVLVMTSPAAAVRLDLGSDHSCAVLTSGAVVCFGNDDFGQLGNDGPFVSSSTPVQMALSAPATAVAVGHNHTCALLVGGSVACAGDNRNWQITSGLMPVGVPFPVAFPRPAIAVSAGWAQTCALLDDRSVWCRGSIWAGGPRLAEPTRIPLPAQAIAITSGQEHTCAALVTGAVYCLGSDRRGQLGNGAGDATGMTPRRVLLGGSALAITAGVDHTCARRPDGTVWCWGEGGSGQLGDGGSVMRTRPVKTTLGGLARSVAAGAFETCVVLRSRALRCFGSDGWGEIGNGLPLANEPLPAAVPLPGPAAAVAIGGTHACVVLRTGGVTCFGDDFHGKLGNGPLVTGLQPSALLAPSALPAGSVAVG